MSIQKLENLETTEEILPKKNKTDFLIKSKNMTEKDVLNPTVRAHASIDLKKLASNIQNIKNYIGENTKLMAVVKADGYGHGAIEIAKTAVENGTQYLGVATMQEGIELRQAGIDTPILILGYTFKEDLEDSLLNDLEITIFDMESLEVLSDISAKIGKKATIHIKIDTGMGRIGFSTEDKTIDDIKKISSDHMIEIKGIYSHLAQSDSNDKSFANHQMQLFKEFLESLEEKGVIIPIKHIANSGAVLDLRQFNMNMVRAGIIIYGLKPSNEVNFSNIKLEPVLEWKSRLSFVKTVPKGHNIGYGRTFCAKRETIVGTVPVGYADGYSRSLSNCGKVLVNGEFAPIIGLVCMDQFMVDLTELTTLERAKAGAEVILIGKQGENEISAEDIADLRKTISYEVVCNIGRRIKRIYTK